MNKIIALLLIVISLPSFAQNEDNNWFFGGKYNANFPENQDPTEPISGLNFNMINAGLPLVNNSSPYLYSENHTAISDQNGNLLFYTDGVFIWDKNHAQMPNGANIGGNVSSMKSSLIVPFPGNINKYYVFAMDGHATGTGAGLFYSIVDMTLNNCLGDVEAVGKKTLVQANTHELLLGTYHGNGTDYWILTGTDGSNVNGFSPQTPKLYAYHVSAAGISAPTIIDLGAAPYNLTTMCFAFRMNFNNQGNKIALLFAGLGTTPSVKFILNFDNNTGIFTFNQTYDNNNGAAFLIFSPNDQFLYEGFLSQIGGVWVNQLIQYNMNAVNITNSKTVVGTFITGGRDARLGPNGKIYISIGFPNAQFLNVIHNPNGAGITCNLTSNTVNLAPRRTSFLPNVFLKPIISPQQIDFTYQDTCLNSNTLFNYISTLNYDSLRWEFGDGQVNITTTQTTQHTYATVGNYNVILTLFDGCTTEIDTLKNINIVNGSTVNLGADVPICGGQTIILNAGNPGATYLWNDNSTNQTLNVTIPGTYWITLVDGNCTSTDTVEVTSIAPVISLGNDTGLCVGDSIILDAGATGATYLWNTGQITPTITVLTAGIYSVEVNVNGCIGNDSITILTFGLPNVNAGNDVIVCKEELVTLIGSGANTYIWDNGIVDGIPFSPNNTQIYTITGTDLHNCVNTDQLTVTVKDKPTVLINASKNEICKGESIILSGSGANTYTWDNNVSNNIAFFPVQTTTYTVIGASVNNCKDTSQIIVFVTESQKINLLKDTVVCLGKSIIMTPGFFSKATYLWQDGSTQASFSVTNEGEYWVEVQFGVCPKIKKEVKITTKDCDCVAYIPNSFTPNNDNLNDKFKITLNCEIDNYELLIFNRWGENIFKTHVLNQYWDGTYLGGKVQNGVYSYQIKYKSKHSPVIHKKNGHINVIL
jgi:gliding motility-associated-like protein